MNLNDRVEEAVVDSDAWFPNLSGDIPHYLIALAGETGELCNAYKKWDRAALEYRLVEQNWEDTRVEMTKELVDVLVYLFCLAGELNIDLEAEYDCKRAFNESRFGQPVSVEAG